MDIITEKKTAWRFSPAIWVFGVVLVYALLFFHRVVQPDWIFSGDTLNGFARHAYQYSGFARGEYPIWNPLVRGGQSEEIAQVFQLANPISNVVIAICVQMGVQDIVLSYSIYIFAISLLFVVGIYRLVSCWTKNPSAGAFAAILALGSSTVFYNTYHINFLLITYALPWMLYAVTMYTRKFKFKYLIIFALAYSVALYSYQFVMGIACLIMLLIAAMFFYRKEFLANWLIASKIPVWHIFALGGILVFMTLPALLMFLRFNGTFLSISRAVDIKVMDDYTLRYNTSSPIIAFSPLLFFFSPRFWVTLFTGVFTGCFEELRQYVGPLTFLFIPIALFPRFQLKDNVMQITFSRRACCIALSALLIMMSGHNMFPFNLLYKLPGFSLIRNTHFFMQFYLVSLIIIAGFGLDELLKSCSKKIFNVTCGVLLFFLLTILFSSRTFSTQNVISLWLPVITTVIILFFANFLPRRVFANCFLCVTALVVLASTFAFGKLPMSGVPNNNPVMLAVRDRSDHALQFCRERPLDIEVINLPDSRNDFGRDEFLSYVTLRDNSYKTKGRLFGQSSLPLFKSYYLFMSLPGHEEVMKNKFLFFKKCYTSSESADMLAFKRDPGLLEMMIKRGIGMSDQLDTEDVSLGSFDPEAVKTIPLEAKENAFEVKVTEYKANSIVMTVSVNHTGLFTYTDLWDDGWMVKVDGKEAPLRKVFHTFKGVELSPGIHEIMFYYRSKTLIALLAMNFFFILCVLGLILYTIWNKKHNFLRSGIVED